MDPYTITDAVNSLSGMSITYSAKELETNAGQMNPIGKMSHGCQVYKRNKGTC